MQIPSTPRAFKILNFKIKLTPEHELLESKIGRMGTINNDTLKVHNKSFIHFKIKHKNTEKITGKSHKPL